MSLDEAMTYGLTTLASAVAGVVAERTLHISGRFLEPVWYRTGGRALRQRRRERESNLRLSLASVFTVGPGRHDLFVLEVAPLGFHPEHIAVGPNDRSQLSTLWGRLPAHLRPDEIGPLDGAVQQERLEIEQRPGAWNARRCSLRGVTVSRVGDDEQPALRLTFGESDYATHLVVSRKWSGHYRSGQAGELSEESLRTVFGGLSHSFGVNLTIETADDSVVLTRRSALTNGAHGLRHISVNEGMALEDRNSEGLPDPYVTAVRGVREELGVDLSDYRDRITFHALILDVTRYEWALLGHVDLRGSQYTDASFKMHRGVGMSVDDWESDELVLQPWSAESVMSLLESDDGWVGHGYLNLLLSGIYRFPKRRAQLLAQAQRAMTRSLPTPQLQYDN